MAEPEFQCHADHLKLIDEIYLCAIEPARWPAVLERLAQLVGARSAVISSHHAADNSVHVRARYNVSGEFERAMSEAIALNPVVPAIWHYGVEEPFSSSRFVGDDAIRSTAWYGKTLGPNGYHDSLIVMLEKSPAQFGALSFMRDATSPNFGDADFELIRNFAPHIRRAAMIADMLEVHVRERESLSNTLDLMNAGVILTNKDGAILHANGAATRMLDDGSAIRRDNDSLAARDADAARELALAIEAATSGTTANIPRSGIVVVFKAHNATDLAAWVLPLDRGLRHSLGAGHDARAAIFVRELADTVPFPAELFVRRYAITPAESRLLFLLTQGVTIGEAADLLGIARATAKTHLAHLFDKTGTQRQADLVRLAMSALAPASAPT